MSIPCEDDMIISPQLQSYQKYLSPFGVSLATNSILKNFKNKENMLYERIDKMEQSIEELKKELNFLKSIVEAEYIFVKNSEEENEI